MELTPELMIMTLAGTVGAMGLGFYKLVLKVWGDFKTMHDAQLTQRKEEMEDLNDQRKADLVTFAGKFERIEDRQIKALAIIVDNKEQARESKHAIQNLAMKIKCQESA